MGQLLEELSRNKDAKEDIESQGAVLKLEREETRTAQEALKLKEEEIKKEREELNRQRASYRI